MKILSEITERSLGLSQLGVDFKNPYQLRKSARAIVLNDSGLMAVQYLANHGFYKLPGGGVEDNEELEVALSKMESNKIYKYEASFMSAREKTFLQEYLKITTG